MKKPIFIVGPHRSGSTLWHNLIAMSPEIMRLSDPRFLGRPGQLDFEYFLRTQARDLSERVDVDTMVQLCFSRKSIPGLEGAFWRFEGIDVVDDSTFRSNVADRIVSSPKDVGTIAKIILEELARFSGYERVCVKFPVDVTRIDELSRWFPDCKIVHITRDPRAVAMSKSNDPSGTAMKASEHPRLAWVIRKAALWMVIQQYRTTARLHARFEQLQNYRLFKYEDLLACPEQTVKELCDFIEVRFTQDLLEIEKGRHEHQPSSLTGKRRREFDPEAAIRWRATMPALDRWLISAMTRRSMSRMRYDPVTHPIYRRGYAAGANGSTPQGRDR